VLFVSETRMARAHFFEWFNIDETVANASGRPLVAESASQTADAYRRAYGRARGHRASV
jgi:uncharacterized protein with PIN domain